MIADSVAFLAGEGKRVIYDAEHFFDAWRTDRDYALRCVRAAAYEAGAENVTLCDTNGASLPHEVAEAVRAVATTGIPVGIHTHNDAECGVAELARGRRRGAVLVQGTLNGYGERCGNMNLTSIVPNLQLKQGHDCLPALEELTEASHLLAELLNPRRTRTRRTSARTRSPTGSGMHIAGVAADPANFSTSTRRGRQRARGAGLQLSGKGR